MLVQEGGVALYSPSAVAAGVRKEEARGVIRGSGLSARVLYLWRGRATHVVRFALLN